MKPTGFHGDKADAFYIHACEDVMRDWWNDKHDTFVPMRTFCTNSSFVRVTRTGGRQCKCHGHPVDQAEPGLDDPLRYADGTILATRMQVRHFLKHMMTAADACHDAVARGQSNLIIGYNHGDETMMPPLTPVVIDATAQLCKYGWSKTRQPITTLILTFNQPGVSGTDVDTYFIAWETGTHLPVEYALGREDDGETLGRTTLDAPVHMWKNFGVRFIHRNVTAVFFLCAPHTPTLATHAKALEEFGFAPPSQLKTNALGLGMTSLGIERLRYLELVREGPDTRGIAALLMHLHRQKLGLEWHEYAVVEVIDGGNDDGDAPSGEPGADPSGDPPVVNANYYVDIECEGVDHRLSTKDLPRIGRHYGIDVPELEVAFLKLVDHRLFYGLLQHYKYSYLTGMFEWYTVVPDGGWSSYEHQGKTRRMSLRKYIVIAFHDAPLGGHRDRDHTRDAIHDAGLTWTNMKKDIDGHISHCQVCRWSKGRSLVTGMMRSREMEGPFRVLVIDFVGPMYPKTKRGNLYMFTCACPFSGWYWAIPVPADDGLTAASTFAERVMFDLAGVACVLCSDRARAFVEGVIAQLNKVFGINSVLVSALHPQSQSPAERPHREYKTLCKQFMEEFGDQWDVVAPMFQWSVRTHCKVYNGRYTPYEMITGMKPRTMIDSLLSTPAKITKRNPDDYVGDLVKYMKRVHAFVQVEHKRIRDQEQERRVRNLGSDTVLDVGDYVMLKRNPKTARPGEHVSARFQNSTDTRLFQVNAVTGGDPAKARTYTLMDPATGSTNFEFSQPVAAERLVPIEMLPLTHAHGEKTRIRANDREGDVTATCVDGKVYIQWDGETQSECIDLSRMPHEFIA
jgi:hypothetical protein